MGKTHGYEREMMKKLTNKKRLKNIGFGIVFAVLLMALIYGFSWIITCGLIKLITMCFGWTFKWRIATGIWLVIVILKSIFSHHTTINK